MVVGRVLSREDHVYALTLRLELRVAAKGGGPASGRHQTRGAAALHTTDRPRGTAVNRDHAWWQAGLQVPEPLFATTTPAGRRASCPTPLPPASGQPDPPCPGEGSGVRRLLRWVRCPDDDDCLHLLAPTEIPPTTTQDHARALCGQRVGAEDLTLTSGLSWALCARCVAAIPAEMIAPAARTTTTETAGRPPSEPLTPGLGSQPDSYPSTPR
jgi:hypothetical protein